MNIHPALLQELHRLREHEIAASVAHAHPIAAPTESATSLARRGRFVRHVAKAAQRPGSLIVATADLGDGEACCC